MEWTPRALGNRSILAWPKARYVLDNLNVFLKRRESYRGYGVSVCAEDVAAHFSGPALSPFMEFDYDVNNRDDFQECLPAGASRLRVHTVDDDTAPMLRRILKALGALTALPVVVNTSFNGFNEPIVCSPRDAVRAFYGTGLDIAAIGPFVLSK
jgi:carbamoyltransferase